MQNRLLHFDVRIVTSILNKIILLHNHTITQMRLGNYQAGKDCSGERQARETQIINGYYKSVNGKLVAWPQNPIFKDMLRNVQEKDEREKVAHYAIASQRI